MIPLKNRIPMKEIQPIREVRPKSSKIIFISCEGCVTEEEYFKVITEIYSNIKSKIRFVSVMEDILATKPHLRTEEDRRTLSKSQPHQLVEKMDYFKENKNQKYEFDKHLDDEFWIVTDVDHHTSDAYIEKWNDTLMDCDDKGYNYAVSNPFFEIWLLIHHSDIESDDYDYAVTDSHEYERTNYYRERLRSCSAPLKDKKHIKKDYYNKEKVENAIERAKELSIDLRKKWPENLGSTVYLLLEKIVDMQ